jgi:hypothetical protein
METILLVAVVILGIGVIIAFCLIIGLFRGRHVSSQTTIVPGGDTEFRGHLARAVTTWALIAVAALAAVIVLCAGIYAISISFSSGADTTAKKEASALFFSTAQYVLGALLPVVAAWVGTVLAFYFGKENFEAAARSTSSLVRQLTPRERLQSKRAEELMLKLNDITYYRVAVGSTDSTVKLKALIDEGFEKNRTQPRNRLPILDSEDRAK